MKKTLVIVYWLLLLVPALVIGGLALRLLRHEGARLDSAAAASARGRAQVLADQVVVSVQELEEKMGESLAAIPRAGRVETLSAWERDNPLIRNAFALDAKGGFVHPDPAVPLTGEQEHFIRRYEGLFSGRVPWEKPAADAVVAAASSPAYASPRREFARLADSSFAKVSAAAPAAPARAGASWIPWYADNQLHVMGWVKDDADGTRYGVELEMAAVLSRLAPVFAGSSEGGTYALLDGEGRVMFQSGAAGVSSGVVPVATAPIGALLPHWEVGAYGAAGAGAGAGRAFVLVTGLQVALFVAAIVLGGSLLLWQAHRHWRDAMQKTSFVSNVSHEFKTPLTSIRMYAEMLAEGRVKDDARRTEYLKVIVDQSQRLTRLVNNALDFSRLEQKRRAYRPELFDLCVLAEEVLESQRVRLQEAGLRLEVDAPGVPCVVASDRDAVTQAILNVLDNALKYAAEGGQLRVELACRAGRCTARFLDRGPGVAAAHRERIFDNFYRVDDSLTAKQPGCGLGLSIARRMMRDLGGDVRFDPREGGGSVFEVMVPCEAPGGGKAA